MPVEDVTLATTVSTGIATLTMGLVSNYPWVVSTQLGTNVFFVNVRLLLIFETCSVAGQPSSRLSRPRAAGSPPAARRPHAPPSLPACLPPASPQNVLVPYTACGAHGHLYGDDQECAGIPCSCSGNGSDPTQFTVPAGSPLNCSTITPDTCLGTRIPFEQALTATFLEGVVFLVICLTGLRGLFMRIVPKQILLAGACGIGVFISFVSGARGAAAARGAGQRW